VRDLASIQRRFYELATAGEGAIEPGLLGASRRLEVYADAYIARLHDVLADDYPKLRATLGPDAFRELAAAYVRARPPTSFTVRDTGVELPRYVAARDDLPTWTGDLAALERARVEVFDGADAEPLTREALAATPIEQLPELALTLVPASALVPLGWTVDDVWSALEDEAEVDAHLPPQRRTALRSRRCGGRCALSARVSPTAPRAARSPGHQRERTARAARAAPAPATPDHQARRADIRADTAPRARGAAARAA
jgi:hypothetical protein